MRVAHRVFDNNIIYLESGEEITVGGNFEGGLEMSCNLRELNEREYLLGIRNASSTNKSTD